MTWVASLLLAAWLGTAATLVFLGWRATGQVRLRESLIILGGSLAWPYVWWKATQS